MVDATKVRPFNMRLSPDEWAMFESVAAHYSLPVAGMLRMLVKQTHDAIRLDLLRAMPVTGLLSDPALADRFVQEVRGRRAPKPKGGKR